MTESRCTSLQQPDSSPHNTCIKTHPKTSCVSSLVRKMPTFSGCKRSRVEGTERVSAAGGRVSVNTNLLLSGELGDLLQLSILREPACMFSTTHELCKKPQGSSPHPLLVFSLSAAPDAPRIPRRHRDVVVVVVVVVVPRRYWQPVAIAILRAGMLHADENKGVAVILESKK
ncbi:hypothetical protein NQZ68_026166 [Dissostichus eleginoides]|nr:hypothetical protein NQZ68_026166 [Dissostichus eleginoides]